MVMVKTLHWEREMGEGVGRKLETSNSKFQIPNPKPKMSNLTTQDSLLKSNIQHLPKKERPPQPRLRRPYLNTINADEPEKFGSTGKG
jgi:hypothetical protein